jgi:hypothetical protein
MLKDLVKVASRLNSLGLSSEANFIDAVVRKFAHKEETYGGVDTSEAEAFEDGRRTPYKGRDGGHKVGPRRKKVIYNPEELSGPIEEGIGEEFLGGMSYEDLSDDANDARSRRRAKYPALQYDSDGRIIFPEDRPDFSGDPVTHFRGEDHTGGRGRRVHVPSEAHSSHISDEDLTIERLARRLSSLGLTKEARILSSIVKSAGDDTDAPLIVEDTSNWTTEQWDEHLNEDPDEWTDKQWDKYESTAGSKGNGTRDIWEATSEDIAEDGDILDKAHREGVMAFVDARVAGKDPMNCQAAYDDAVAAYKEEFGS